MPGDLKRLPASSLQSAVARAAHYRALNQPEEAESICHDVLAVDKDHQEAWQILGLALTDRFGRGLVGLLEQALAAFEHLSEIYQRTYHQGVAWERAAKVHLEGQETHNAAAAFERALDLYQAAERLCPDLPDPLLRWNRCMRLIAADPSLREAMRAPRKDDARFGD